MKKIFVIAVAAALSLSASAQHKFAHVNMQELVQLMPEMDAARATMNASSKEAQDTYQTMVDEFQSKYQKYQQTGASLSAATKEAREKELTDIQTRIQEFEQSVQQELQQQQQQLMAPIMQKAQKTVENLAKSAGFIYVFDVASVLFIDPAQSTDLTPAARELLGIKPGRTLESLQAELQAQAQAQAAAPEKK